MNIKRLIKTTIFSLLMLSPVHSSYAADLLVPGEVDYYINAALRVYMDTIPPSVNTSELFYNYMERKWQQKQCKDESECKLLGIRVAHEFASNYRP